MDRWSLEKRKDDFMRGIDVEDQRRRLDDFAVSLRVKKRQESQQKRRYYCETPGPQTQIFSTALLTAYPSLADLSEPFESKMKLIHQLLLTPAYLLDALIALRKLLSETQLTEHSQFIDNGTIPVLVSCLDWNCGSEVVKEAAWCLANLAAISSGCVKAILEANGVMALFSVTDPRLNMTNEMTLLALGNICGDASEYRTTLVALGFIDLLCLFCSKFEEIELGVLRVVSWGLSNISKGKPSLGVVHVKPIAEQCKVLLHAVRDKEVRTNLVWTVSNLCHGGEDSINEIIKLGFARDIFNYLRKSKLKKRIQACLRAIGNISTGNELQTQHLVSEGLFDELKIFLDKNQNWALREVLWILSNVAAGTRKQVGTLVDHPIIYCCHMALLSNDPGVCKEASYVFRNISSVGSSSQIMKLSSQGIIMKLAQAISPNDSITLRVRPMQNLLELAEKLLVAGAEEIKPCHNTRNFIAELMEETGIVRKIEALQRHSNPRIYELILKILLTHFDAKEDPDHMQMDVPRVFAFS